MNPLPVPKTISEAYKRFHIIQGNVLGSNWSIESSIDETTRDLIKNDVSAIYVVTHSNIVADFLSLSTIVREVNSNYSIFPVVGENLRSDASFRQFCDAGNVIYVSRKGLDEKMLDRMNATLSKKSSGVYMASTPGISSTGKVEFDKRIGFLLANYSKQGIPIIPVSISYSDFPARDFSVRKNVAVYEHGEYVKEDGEDKQRIVKGLFPRGVNLFNPFSVRRFLKEKPSLCVSFSKPVTKFTSKSSFIAQINSELVNCYHLHTNQKTALAKLISANDAGCLSDEAKDYLSSIHDISLAGLYTRNFDLFDEQKPVSNTLSLIEVSELAIFATPTYQKWNSVTI